MTRVRSRIQRRRFSRSRKSSRRRRKSQRRRVRRKQSRRRRSSRHRSSRMGFSSRRGARGRRFRSTKIARQPGSRHLAPLRVLFVTWNVDGDHDDSDRLDKKVTFLLKWLKQLVSAQTPELICVGLQEVADPGAFVNKVGRSGDIPEGWALYGDKGERTGSYKLPAEAGSANINSPRYLQWLVFEKAGNKSKVSDMAQRAYNCTGRVTWGGGDPSCNKGSIALTLKLSGDPLRFLLSHVNSYDLTCARFLGPKASRTLLGCDQVAGLTVNTTLQNMKPIDESFFRPALKEGETLPPESYFDVILGDLNSRQIGLEDKGLLKQSKSPAKDWMELVRVIGDVTNDEDNEQAVKLFNEVSGPLTGSPFNSGPGKTYSDWLVSVATSDITKNSFGLYIEADKLQTTYPVLGKLPGAVENDAAVLTKKPRIPGIADRIFVLKDRKGGALNMVYPWQDYSGTALPQGLRQVIKSKDSKSNPVGRVLRGRGQLNSAPRSNPAPGDSSAPVASSPQGPYEDPTWWLGKSERGLSDHIPVACLVQLKPQAASA